jgi:DNA-binding NarL/FixJ family response regulator
VIEVVVVDDHPMFREGVVALIDGRSGIQVVAQAGSGDEAVSLAVTHRPRVILLDVEMPGPTIYVTLRHVALASPMSRVVVLTMHDDPALEKSVLDAGATAFLSKRAPARDLVGAIVRASTSPVPSRRARAGIPTLTRREFEVLSLVAAGLTNAAIAERLFISPGTVKRHLSQSFPKLGVHTRTAAVRAARIHGLLT